MEEKESAFEIMLMNMNHTNLFIMSMSSCLLLAVLLWLMIKEKGVLGFICTYSSLVLSYAILLNLEDNYKVVFLVSLVIYTVCLSKFYINGTNSKFIHKNFKFMKPLTIEQVIENGRISEIKDQIKTKESKINFNEGRVKELNNDIENLEKEIKQKRSYINHYKEESSIKSKEIKDLTKKITK